MAVSAADVRSALSLPDAAPSTSQTQKKVKQRDGVPRELYRLIGPSLPALAVPKPPRLKQKPNLGNSADVCREKRKFKNAARKDGLELEHWVKATTDPNEGAPILQYPFAKYNTRPPIHRYTDEEYASWLTSDELWTKQETDYLFAMLNEYDMRWYIVHDRYDFPGHRKRTLEDLKERYFSVCRKLIRNRNAHLDEQVRAQLLSNFQFDKEREHTRRKYIGSLHLRSQDDLDEEEALYIEIKRLEQNERKFKRDRDELLRVIAGIDSGLPDVIEDQDLSLIAVDLKRKKKGTNADHDTPTTPSASHSRATARPLPTDAANCITRTEPSSSLPSTKAAHTAAFVRSYKIPVAKASMAPRVQEIMSELGLTAGRLVMPTAGNIAQLDQLMEGIYLLIDAKKAVDKVELDIRTAKERHGMRASEGADDARGGASLQSRSQSVASGRGRKQARRSASVASSVDASISARPTKRQRR
ncbi:hypothetical protein HDZ31DRAFT_50457 [Schizophyllum fasciatum]